MAQGHERDHIVVIGGGFTGLAAAYELARTQMAVTVIEKGQTVGGLASNFKVAHQPVEKFYHHLFTNDHDAIQLTKQLKCHDQLSFTRSKTGIYVQNKFFSLSSPLDILRFSPLSLPNRIQLGLLLLRARRLKDYKSIESVTAEQWLKTMCPPAVYNTVWLPLLRGKFGADASELSAAWFWNKLVLRGRSQDSAAKELLGYYRYGLGAFAQKIAGEIVSNGGFVKTTTTALGLIVADGRIKGVQTNDGPIYANAVIATTPLPIIADLVQPYISKEYLAQLKRIRYLANLSLVLELSRQLSDFYWLNVTDPDFPFVGVIEHTNFQPPTDYDGKHIVYLSKYLRDTNELFSMNKDDLFEFSLPHIQRMFPEFDRSWVQDYHLFKARYAQPVVECNYPSLIPRRQTPIKGLYIETMAHIYPQDRGCNYAIRNGRSIAKTIAKQIGSGKP
ncbi:MAG: NAD(P)/FAD-dependent oxidoreductase [Planctomycetota bacterium]|jgi:protoporphyrinogen oxidase